MSIGLVQSHPFIFADMRSSLRQAGGLAHPSLQERDGQDIPTTLDI